MATSIIVFLGKKRGKKRGKKEEKKEEKSGGGIRVELINSSISNNIKNRPA